MSIEVDFVRSHGQRRLQWGYIMLSDSEDERLSLNLYCFPYSSNEISMILTGAKV